MSIVKKYIAKQNFIVGSSGDDSAESNMQSGKDDEDLQKALALSLEPLEDRTGAEFGSLLTWCKKGFRHGSAQFTILSHMLPAPGHLHMIVSRLSVSRGDTLTILNPFAAFWSVLKSFLKILPAVLGR